MNVLWLAGVLSLVCAQDTFPSYRGSACNNLPPRTLSRVTHSPTENRVQGALVAAVRLAQPDCLRELCDTYRGHYFLLFTAVNAALSAAVREVDCAACAHVITSVFAVVHEDAGRERDVAENVIVRAPSLPAPLMNNDPPVISYPTPGRTNHPFMVHVESLAMYAAEFNRVRVLHVLLNAMAARGVQHDSFFVDAVALALQNHALNSSLLLLLHCPPYLIAPLAYDVLSVFGPVPAVMTIAMAQASSDVPFHDMVTGMLLFAHYDGRHDAVDAVFLSLTPHEIDAAMGQVTGADRTAVDRLFLLHAVRHPDRYPSRHLE